jgi:GPH family glycoside/pentoside/hexuronide:cation symporter
VAGGYRIAIAGLAVVAVICMLIPAFGIDERVYADTTPSQSPAFSSLMKTFGNKEFQTFVASDILYWIAFTMFQTGLLFYVTRLMGLDVSWSTILLVLMMGVAFILYIPVNFLAKKIGKKKLIVFAFSFFAVTFGLTAFSGLVGIPLEAWGIFIAVLASVPLAILGVLPQAVVADIAEVDAADTGEARQGMFYAARTFAMKLGQAVSMLVFTGIIAMDIGDMKYRITAVVACVFCMLGAIVFARYHEKSVLRRIGETNEAERLEEAGA